jgi:gliding motility-associated-like protein
VTGAVTYTPNPNFNGTDSFTYNICDTGMPVFCDTATVTVTVTPVNDQMVANDDIGTTDQSTPIVIDVVANDTDIDGNVDPTSVTIVTQPTQGTVSVDPITGNVTYTPNPDACGTDSFVYNVCDDGTPLPATCDQATVTITINDTQAPTIANCPTNIALTNDPGVCGAVVSWAPLLITDNCDTSLNIVQTHYSGQVFPIGVTTVSYTVTDDAGNVSVCSFNIEVSDDEAPVPVNCPSNINSCSELISWTPPTFNDNCTNNLTITSNYSPGSMFPVGSTTVIYTATDSAGNTGTCSFVVTRSAITIVPVFTNISCNGTDDGTATVIVNDAVAPLSFDWGTAGTDSLLTNLAPGNYTVTVTDAIGCSDTATITITDPEVLNLELVKTVPGNCSLADGSAEVIATGGNEPYTYTWSNQQTGPVISFVEAGVYGVTVVDANGCTDTLSVNIKCDFGKIPQLVTPNDDGHNDKWVIPGIEAYPESMVEIYNRWGNLVYRATPYQNDWDGYSMGLLTIGNGRLPAGTYFYVIRFTKDSDIISGYLELQY